MGSSVLGTNGAYERLKSYKRTLSARLQSPFKLYFAKFDVKDAFNMINQDILIKLLARVLALDEYLVQNYVMCYLHEGAHKVKKMGRAMDKGSFGEFDEFALKEAGVFRNVVMTSGYVRVIDRDEILQQIEDHLRNNLIKVKNEIYRQIVGIPQGSLLSTLLCWYLSSSLLFYFLKNAIRNRFLVLACFMVIWKRPT